MDGALIVWQKAPCDAANVINMDAHFEAMVSFDAEVDFIVECVLDPKGCRSQIENMDPLGSLASKWGKGPY